jgi:hypothetical protein
VIARLGQLVRVARGALSPHRETRVRLTASIEAAIYDRPGRWMDDGALGELRAALVGVASAAIPGPLQYGVFLPSRAPFENRLIVTARDTATGEVVGFNAMPSLPVRIEGRGVTVLHLGLLVIHPRFQRRGLQGLLYALGGFSAFHRIPGRPVWLSNVTEVPAIVGAMSDNFANVFPSYADSRPRPDAHLALARAIMAQHRHEFGVGPEATFDEERFVIRGSYTGGSDALKKTFGQAPKYRVDACNAFCERELDYGRGDDLLQIGQLDKAVIARWMGRRIPPELRPAAARQMKLWSYPPHERPSAQGDVP